MLKFQCKCLSFIVVICLSISFFQSIVRAEEQEQASMWHIPDYSKERKSRPTLTGRFGVRTDLAEKGITFSVDSIHTYQNIVDGGTDSGGEYGGSNDYELYLDLGKMGLMPGAFVRIFGETKFGDFVNGNTGTGTAVNTDGLFPEISRQSSTLTAFTYYQFLSEWFALFAGKLDALDGDSNAFAGARGKKQFLNQNFVFNPVTLRTAPYSTLGGGALVVLPEERGTFNIAVLDPNGVPSKVGFDDAFDGGFVLASELKLNVKPFGLPGHQLFGGTWSSKDYTSLGQDLRRLYFEAIVTGIPPSLATSETSWSFYYNFDQYLYVEDEDPSQGIGIFGRFGIADKDTNPVENFYSLGVGGKGIIPGRDEDTFGLGYYYLNTSDKFRLAHEGQGFEAFYNVEIRPWLHITPDFQIIDSAVRSVETNFITGIRFKIDL